MALQRPRKFFESETASKVSKLVKEMLEEATNDGRWFDLSDVLDTHTGRKNDDEILRQMFFVLRRI